MMSSHKEEWEEEAGGPAGQESGEEVWGPAMVSLPGQVSGEALLPLEELRLVKYGCKMRCSSVAATLGWSGVLLRWIARTVQRFKI